MNRISIIAVMLLMLAVPAFAQNLTFLWDPHPESAELQGFWLYQSKTPGTYTQPRVAVFTGGTLTTGTIPRPGLGRWHYVLTAVSLDGLESGFSNEVSVVIKPREPVLKSVVMSALTAPLKGAKKLAEWAGVVERKNLRVKQ